MVLALQILRWCGRQLLRFVVGGAILCGLAVAVILLPQTAGICLELAVAVAIIWLIGAAALE